MKAKTFFLLLGLSLAACNPSPGERAGTADSRTQSSTGEHDEPGHDDKGHDAENAEAGHGDEHNEEGHGDAHGEADELHLTETQLSRLDIRIEPAAKGRALAEIGAPARVAFDADRTALVGPLVAGRVVSVEADLGDQVESGQVLAWLDSVELGRAKAEHLASQARLEASRADYRREQKLAERQISSEADRLAAEARYLAAKAEYESAHETLRVLGLSEAAIDKVRAADDAPLSRFALTSPRAGVMQRRDAVPGQQLAAGETPFQVVDSGAMWLLIDAYEQDLPRLATGAAIRLSVGAMPSRKFPGTVDWVSRALDAEARTVRLRARLPNPDGLLRAGMFGTAHVQTQGGSPVALVALDAVQTVEGEAVVFVPGDEARAFRAQPVRTGEEGDGRIEILGGLAPGDRYVARGGFDLMSALTAASRSADHSH